MAVTTLTGLQNGAMVFPFRKVYTAAEAAGILMSSWPIATSLPTTGATPSTGAGSTCTGATAGSFIPDLSGDVVVSEVRGFLEASVGTTTIFCDRLWHNRGTTVTTTTAQAVNSVAFPSRCLDGTANGLGVMVGIEVTTATTNAGAITNMTLDYTNQAGTAGRTGTISSFPATCVVNSFIPFLLAGGDTGVRSIQNITLGTSLVTGAINIVAYIPVIVHASLFTGKPGVSNLDRALTRLRPSTCLFQLDHRNATTAQTFSGSITVTNG